MKQLKVLVSVAVVAVLLFFIISTWGQQLLAENLFEGLAQIPAATPTPTPTPTPSPTPPPVPTTVQIDSSQTIPGQVLNLNVSVKSITDPQGLGGYDLRVSFTAGVMELQDVIGGDAPFNSITAKNWDNAAGWVEFSHLRPQAPGPTGDIVVARLQVKAIGAVGDSTPLDLSIVGLWDTAGDDIPAQDVDGTFTIRGGISVQVLTPAGQPAVNAEVQAFHDLGAWWDFWGRTDQSGELWLDVAPGSYTLIASSYGDRFLWVAEGVQAPGERLLDATAAVELEVTATDLEGQPLAAGRLWIGVPRAPSKWAFNVGFAGGMDEAGRATAWVTSRSLYHLFLWSWGDLYYLEYPNEDVSQPRSIAFDARGMPTGRVQALIYDFPWMRFIPWGAYNVWAPVFGPDSGDWVTLSADNYSVNRVLSKGIWVYQLQQVNLEIAAADELTLEQGGSFSLEVKTGQPFYEPGSTVSLNIDFSDAFGNPLPWISKWMAEGAGRERAHSPDIAFFMEEQLYEKTKGGPLAFGMPPLLSPAGWEQIPLILRVYNPSGELFLKQEWTYYPESFNFNLPPDAVEGVYTVQVTVDTGPHQGILDSSAVFGVGEFTGLAETGLGPGLDTDLCAGCAPAILEIVDAQTGQPMPVKVGGYLATFTYPGNLLQVLEIRLKPPFDTGEANIDNPGGKTAFSGLAPAGAEAPIDPLAFLTLRLVGTVLDTVQATLTFDQIADFDGNSIIQQEPLPQLTFRRGDAKADGAVNIADALFVAQHLAGKRGVGIGLDKVNPVNAASIRWDGACDKITIADVLFLAQYLVGLRNPDMTPKAFGSPPAR